VEALETASSRTAGPTLTGGAGPNQLEVDTSGTSQYTDGHHLILPEGAAIMYYSNGSWLHGMASKICPSTHMFVGKFPGGMKRLHLSSTYPTVYVPTRRSPTPSEVHTNDAVGMTGLIELGARRLLLEQDMAPVTPVAQASHLAGVRDWCVNMASKNNQESLHVIRSIVGKNIAHSPLIGNPCTGRNQDQLGGK